MARKRRPDPAALVIAIAIIAGAILLNVAVFGIVILLAGLIYCWLRERRPEENPTARDLLPNLPSFIRRVCSGYAPDRGVLRTQSV